MPVEQTALDAAFDFLQRFGLFKWILPFLLVFTVVFAILEKTRILGTEGTGKDAQPKKNLDAMVAFTIALLVVIATEIVGIINTALPRVVLLLIVSLSFLLLVGIFFKPGEDLYERLKGGWNTAFMIGVLEAPSGDSWLRYTFDFVLDFWSGAVVGSIVVLIVVIIAIFIIVGGKSKTAKES
jgi:hypothetical protein